MKIALSLRTVLGFFGVNIFVMKRSGIQCSVLIPWTVFLTNL